MAGAREQSQERAPTTKEMTKQHTESSSMFSIKFIKNCFMYSCVEHTGILHTGSNQHNEPINYVLKIGWTSCILPTKVGGANPRPMCTTNCGLELTEAPTQARVPHQMRSSPENKPQRFRSSCTKGQSWRHKSPQGTLCLKFSWWKRRMGVRDR